MKKLIGSFLLALLVFGLSFVAVGCANNNTTAKATTAKATTAADKTTAEVTTAKEDVTTEVPTTAEGQTTVAPTTTEAPVTTTHTHEYGEWQVVREATCTEEGLKKRVCACGDEETASIDALGHLYADDYTCHDRTCTREDCGYVCAATTDHVYGDWTTVKEASCIEAGSKSRTCQNCGYVETEAVTVDHSFGADFICTSCHKNLKELFLVSVSGSTVTCNVAAGTYEVSNTESNTYAMIPGSILTSLKNLGCTTLTITCTNPAPTPCDEEPKCKSLYVAADKGDNLWSADTAIAFYGWQAFWDNGRQETFTINVETYAGRDIIFYSNYCNTYPLQIAVKEFAELENKSTWITGETNSTVAYYEGKGWVITATDSNAYYARLSGDTIAHYLDKGCNTIRFYFANDLGIEGISNTGNYVNNDTRIMPAAASDGADDWDYFDGKFVISQFATYDSATGLWYADVDMADTTHLFNRYIRFYISAADASGNATPNAYIADIQFLTLTVEDKVAQYVSGNSNSTYNSNAAYYEGKGWVISAVDTTKSGYYGFISSTAVQYYIKKGCTALRIDFSNDLGIDGITNAGNFVNNRAAIVPEKANNGGQDWYYANNYISQFGTLDSAAGTYYFVIDLTDATYDFTKDITLYFSMSDVSGNATANAYISSMQFMTAPQAKDEITATVNCSVTYYEGKGWLLSATDTSSAYYVDITADTMKYYLAMGCTKLTIYFTNDLGIEGIANTGNFINVKTYLLPFKSDGSDDWTYHGGYISQLTNDTTASVPTYYFEIDLTDTTYDFTKGFRLYLEVSDVSSNAVPYGYISALKFEK